MSSVFNAQNTEWRTGKYQLFMGQAPALHDTINVNYPQISKLWSKQITNRWMFDEFNHEQSKMDFLQCPKSVYQIMLMNLAYQWEADSVAARAIAPAFAPFVTCGELWEALLENTNMEAMHAKTYSNIVQKCVANPQEVFKLVMESEQTLARADTVNKALSNLVIAGAQLTLKMRKPDQSTYNILFKAICALYFLERLQFVASFAATFAIVEQGYFQSIGKAVQKIMLDEIDCHAALDRDILRIELKTERGQRAWEQCKDEITAMLVEIIGQELQFGGNDYLFADGRAIVGYNATLNKEWVLFNGFHVADELKIELPFERIEKNPLPWMDNWIDIDKTQNANQEADNNNYALNVVKDDLGDDILDF